MGRKKISPKDRKEEWVKFRVTSAQMKTLKARAKAAGLPLGTWLRQLGLDGCGGAGTNFPVSTLQRSPCNGHVTQPLFTASPFSGAPRCGQKSSKATACPCAPR